MARPRTASMPAPDLAADRARAFELTPVSRETAARLDQLVALVQQWQAKTNLVAPSTLPQLWTRHVADSLQLLTLARQARRWIDLGSGAGFPGLVIAAAIADRPGALVHLVESNLKKAAFLREAARQLEAPVRVHAARIEDMAADFREPVDVVTARALAPLETLLGLAFPFLKTGAQGLFLKGQDVDAELTQASKYWNMEMSLVPSRTHHQSRIVVVRGLSPRHPS